MRHRQGRCHGPVTLKEAGKRQATRQKEAERVRTDVVEEMKGEEKRFIQGDELWQIHVPSSPSQQNQFRIDLGDRKFECILYLFLLPTSTLYFDDWSFGTSLENAKL